MSRPCPCSELGWVPARVPALESVSVSLPAFESVPVPESVPASESVPVWVPASVLEKLSG